MKNPSNEVEVYKSGSMQYMDSREVAEIVEKKHYNLVRDIKRYSTELAKLNFEFSDFFIESSYSVEGQSRKYPYYLITKKGCEFIANKLTGIKGTKFTATYINRFHEMEDELVTRPRILSPLEQLQLQSQAILEVNNKVVTVGEKVSDIKKEFEEFKQDMPLMSIECDKITTTVRRIGTLALGGKSSNAYHDRSLSGKVYSDIYKELKRQFQVGSYKSIKRNQCDMALDIIQHYKLPVALKEQIDNSNAQLNMEVL